MAFAPLALLPKPVLDLGKEILRHLLRRPVVGVAVAGRTDDGRWLLIRRGDTGTWAFAGGTVEWGETMRSTIARELVKANLGLADPPDGDRLALHHASLDVVLCATRRRGRCCIAPQHAGRAGQAGQHTVGQHAVA